MVGNPPFIGGQKITGLLGTNYRDYLIVSVGAGLRGSADIVAYFFLRAAQLSTAMAFLAVNTISQGYTRTVGLETLAKGGWSIYRAVRSQKWPGAAGIHIAEVWLSRNATSGHVLDGMAVSTISPFLRWGDPIESRPFPLSANTGVAFIGSYVLGLGFLLERPMAQALLQQEPRNSNVIFPYVNAEDLCTNTNGAPSRWVINFHGWSEEEARTYTECYKIIEALVRPERQRKHADGTYQVLKTRAVHWWQYAARASGLYTAMSSLRFVIAMPRISKIVLPLRYSSRLVFSELICVFASEDARLYATLTSTPHREWARRYSSTLETRTNYSPSNSFLTFPMSASEAGEGALIETIDSVRRDYMTAEQIGMTSLYNRVHDAANHGDAVNVIRELHEQLDRAVCEAYGWNDLDLGYGFHDTEEGKRWTMSEDAREEVLRRLLALNQERHAKELAAGVKKGKAAGKTKAGESAGISLLPNLR